MVQPMLWTESLIHSFPQPESVGCENSSWMAEVSWLGRIQNIMYLSGLIYVGFMKVTSLQATNREPGWDHSSY